MIRRVESLDRGDDKDGALAMTAIPVHLQRRFEQRWASRFGSQTAPIALENAEAKPTPSNSPNRPATIEEAPVAAGEQFGRIDATKCPGEEPAKKAKGVLAAELMRVTPRHR
jgi:hypothetical protein